MKAKSGRDAVLEVLRTEGVRHVFGNPGSTELPFIDALATAPDIHYVLALQEATVVAMADGYAQATGRPAFMNLHTSAGLGNAIGNLTNAQANRSPLVVTAGQQDWRHLYADPLLGGDLVAIAAPVSKWAHEVRTLAELPIMLRRAFHDAAAAPAGPVFLSLPMSLLDAEGEVEVPPPSRIERRTVPTADVLGTLAELISSTEPGRLAFVAGDEVAAYGAVGALVAVAERLGVAVHPAPLNANAVFPPSHPCFAGPLPPAAAGIRAVLSRYERIVFVGGRAFMVYPYTDGSPLPDDIGFVHISADISQIGRTYATELGICADPRSTLEALLDLLPDRHDLLEKRRAARAAEIDNLEATARERYGPAPLDPMAAAHALVRAVPPDTIVVDEAITTGVYVRGFHHWTVPGRYFFAEGGGLGWGMPAALGVCLAHDRTLPVLSVVGDGSAMYSPQALWTAAHEQLPVVFAVVNNRQYLILKNNLRGMKGDAVESGRFIGLDLDDPPIDYVGLARSLGVEARLIDDANDIGDAVKAALASGRPHLLEIPISAPA
ncbi:MAG: thiamine pyrophosphate-binding protein [Acidimicrobiales bacterium]